MNKAFSKSIKWFIDFIQIQTFLSLVSLPVLVAWGIPFSALTFLGNLLFTPFLTLFLLCSSCIFFLELLTLPNTFLIGLLEYLTKFWLWSLSCGSNIWMFALSEHFFIFTLITSLIGCFIIFSHHLHTTPKTIFLCITLCIPFIIQHYYKPNTKYNLMNKKKNCTFIPTKNGLILHDYGAFKQSLRPEQWIDYTFIPTLIKKYGLLSLEKIYLHTPSKRTLQALIRLQEHLTIKKIYFMNNHSLLFDNNKKNITLITKLIQKSTLYTKVPV